jgi:hypothetical protein
VITNDHYPITFIMISANNADDAEDNHDVDYGASSNGGDNDTADNAGTAYDNAEDNHDRGYNPGSNPGGDTPGAAYEDTGPRKLIPPHQLNSMSEMK